MSTQHYYYATEQDSDGNILTTSYVGEASARKFRPNAKIKGPAQFIRKLDEAGNLVESDGGMLIRSHLKRIEPVEQGKFQIWGRNGTEPLKQVGACSNYGNGNQAMKEVFTSLYDELFIVETLPESKEPSEDDDFVIGF